MNVQIAADRVFNFNAGPSALPLSVLEKAKEELLSYAGAGMSVMEMSHRSKEFMAILDRAEQGLRFLLNVPDDYSILFLGGGASLQFSMVPMNLAGKDKSVDLIHTGAWTKKAMSEIKKVTLCHTVVSGEGDKFLKLPSLKEATFNSGAAYVHMASNNTIFGTQWKTFPTLEKVPLVADMSSDILSRHIDVKNFGLIFAGAQKNLGPSGVTVVIIRKDLAERADASLPTMLQYRTHIKENSLYNTPPAFSIYILALVMDWVKENHGLTGMEKKNQEKAAALYQEIDRTGFYSCPVNKPDRSLMNVVFRIKNGDEKLEETFVKEAKQNGLVGLKGHRSVGGLRASIYNAQPLEGATALVSFMKEFEKKNG